MSTEITCQSSAQLGWKIVGLPVVFVAATGGLWLLTSLAPDIEKFKAADKAFDQFPKTLEEVRFLTAAMRHYSQSYYAYVAVLFAFAYLYIQAFNIPGSLFLNLLAGALYGVPIGLIYVTLLTAVGSLLCYSLTVMFMKEMLVKLFGSKISYFQSKIDENSQQLFGFLVSIRFIPMSTGWLFNVLLPIFGVPRGMFFTSVLIGMVPYNWVTVQAGLILSEIRSIDDVFSMGNLVQFAIVAMGTFLPTVWWKRRSKLISTPVAAEKMAI